MLERLAGWGILKNARYEEIDLSPDHIFLRRVSVQSPSKFMVSLSLAPCFWK